MLNTAMRIRNTRVHPKHRLRQETDTEKFRVQMMWLEDIFLNFNRSKFSQKSITHQLVDPLPGCKSDRLWVVNQINKNKLLPHT